MKLHKKPLVKIFLIQYGLMLGFEAGLVISYYYVDFSFYTFQLLLIPIFTLLIISKYNKSITTIIIDYDNKLFKLKQNYFLLLTKSFEIPFEKIFFQIKWKWLLNYYSKVIEIKKNNQLIAVIPLKGSIWNKSELNHLIYALIDLERKNEIRANLSSY